jgi:fatty acid desaturase
MKTERGETESEDGAPETADRSPVKPEFSVALPRYSRAGAAARIRTLSRVSNLRSIVCIATQWAIIIGSGALAVWSRHPMVYVAAALIIGSRIIALGVLMHEGAHWLLFTNRTVNDIVCDLFVSFPLGFSTTLYRDTHFRHHRFTNTDDDPDLVAFQDDDDWQWPKSRSGCAWLIVRSVLGLNIARLAKLMQQWSPWHNLFTPLSPAFPLRARLLLIPGTVVFFTLIIWNDLLVPAILLYLIPLLTLANLFNRVRATAEHVRTDRTHELDSTRTVIPTLGERIFIAPLGINYHLEHHLFPSVPGHNLKTLHRILMEDDEYRRRAHVTYSYRRGLLRELMAKQDGTEHGSKANFVREAATDG